MCQLPSRDNRCNTQCEFGRLIICVVLNGYILSMSMHTMTFEHSFSSSLLVRCNFYRHLMGKQIRNGNTPVRIPARSQVFCFTTLSTEQSGKCYTFHENVFIITLALPNKFYTSRIESLLCITCTLRLFENYGVQQICAYNSLAEYPSYVSIYPYLTSRLDLQCFISQLLVLSKVESATH